MISETITIPKTISEGEDRFVIKLKENLLRMIKEINRNGKRIDTINGEDLPDYTDDFKKKVNVIANNIGYGKGFEETEDYTIEDNLIDWGSALTNKDNKIEEENKKLVSSQNVYNETHPYMEKDGQGGWINPYHYINYKDLIKDEEIEDINKQDRYVQGDTFEPHIPNDNMVKENLIALDTAIYDLSKKIKDTDISGKANVELDNITREGGWVINDIAMVSVAVESELGSSITVRPQIETNPVNGIRTMVYYIDYDGGETPQDLTNYALRSAQNMGFVGSRQPSGSSEYVEDPYSQIGSWLNAMALQSQTTGTYDDITSRQIDTWEYDSATDTGISDTYLSPSANMGYKLNKNDYKHTVPNPLTPNTPDLVPYDMFTSMWLLYEQLYEFWDSYYDNVLGHPFYISTKQTAGFNIAALDAALGEHRTVIKDSFEQGLFDLYPPPNPLPPNDTTRYRDGTYVFKSQPLGYNVACLDRALSDITKSYIDGIHDYYGPNQDSGTYTSSTEKLGHNIAALDKALKTLEDRVNQLSPQSQGSGNS